MRARWLLPLLAALACLPAARAGAAVAVLPASKDNSIYSENADASNGEGTGIFSLHQTQSGDQTHALHRLLADWGEAGSVGLGFGGDAQPGDATWEHTSYPTELWASPGGDFAGTPSASAVAGAVPDVVIEWSSASMVADVQGWLDAPAANFGWILIGNESVVQSAKRFDSSESTEVGDRPELEVQFTPPPQVPAAGRWALGALALLLCGGAAAALGRRAST
jgi:hypothetical protein